MNLAENLKRIRKENNLSQEQLAEKLGVSRQAVSKWESNQAYPEMDKVLQLAKMFNLNVDDLLNQDVKEVTNEKQSKMAINKYIDDFLGFFTKTIDMFSNMKPKDRFKCIFEQFIIIALLLIIFAIINVILSNALFSIIYILPSNVYNIFSSIFNGIYLIIALALSIILLIHIFKVRYLDYYVSVNEKEVVEEKNNIKEEKKETNGKENKTESKQQLKKSEEKIIIRDPKHSEYKFISGMLKCLLFFVKTFTLCIVVALSMSLICLVFSLVVSFLIAKTGLFFVGILLSLIACIIINLIIIIILINFIMSKKNKKGILLISFILSLLTLGIGIGISIIDFTSFNYIDDINNNIFIKDEITIPMKENLIIENYYYNSNIEYIEEDRSDIRVVYKHTKYYKLLEKNISYVNDDYVRLEFALTNNNIFDFARNIIKDINDKNVMDYSKTHIYIHTSKENIQKLKDNTNNYYKSMEESYYNKLVDENTKYQNKIYELEEQLTNSKERLQGLESELNASKNELRNCYEN